MASIEWKLVALGIVVSGAGCSAPKSASPAHLPAPVGVRAPESTAPDPRAMSNMQRYGLVGVLRDAASAASARGDRAEVRAKVGEAVELLTWTRPEQFHRYEGMFRDLEHLARSAGDHQLAERARQYGTAVSVSGGEAAARRHRLEQLGASIVSAAASRSNATSGERGRNDERGGEPIATPEQIAAAVKRATEGDTSQAESDARIFSVIVDQANRTVGGKRIFEDKNDDFAWAPGGRKRTEASGDPEEGDQSSPPTASAIRDLIEARLWLARLYNAQNKFAEAKRELDLAWAALAGFAVDDGLVSEARTSMAVALRGLGDEEGARAFETGALAPGEPWTGVQPRPTGGSQTEGGATENGASNARRGDGSSGNDRDSNDRNGAPSRTGGGSSGSESKDAPGGNAPAPGASSDSGASNDLAAAETRATNGDHAGAASAFLAVLESDGDRLTESERTRALEGRGRALEAHANALRAGGDLDAAYEEQKKAVEFRTQFQTETDPRTVAARASFAEIGRALVAAREDEALQAQRRCELERARVLRERIVAVLRESMPDNRAALERALRDHAAVLRVLERTDEAKIVEDAADAARAG